MAEYITLTDQNVALNSPIPFNQVSIRCGSGTVIPVAPGIVSLRGGSNGNFARYDVSVSANVQIPTGGAVTPIALGIKLNGTTLPQSVAIITHATVAQYEHIYTEVTVTVPSGCCFEISAAYVDGTEDDAATTPTPSITVRRQAALKVTRVA